MPGGSCRAAGPRPRALDLLRVEAQRARERQELLAEDECPAQLADLTEGQTNQNEQIANVPSSPERPSSVSSVR